MPLYAAPLAYMDTVRKARTAWNVTYMSVRTSAILVYATPKGASFLTSIKPASFGKMQLVAISPKKMGVVTSQVTRTRMRLTVMMLIPTTWTRNSLETVQKTPMCLCRMISLAFDFLWNCNINL